METCIPHSSPWITAEDIAAVSSVLTSGQIAQGGLVKQFETAVAEYLGYPHAWALSSGQVALVRALGVIGVREGSKVLLPTYVCRAVADAIRNCGAIPIFCDVGEDWCLTAAAVEKSITRDTAAIVVVHPFGIKAAVPPLLQFRVPVVEDCCQRFSPDVGHVGAMAVYSFHATKCLTTAEGGMVATSDPEIARRYNQHLASFPESARMSECQAALGLSQLARYEIMLGRRILLAERYKDGASTRNMARLSEVWNRSIFFRFPLTLSKGYECVAPQFEAHGVSVRRGVDSLLHRQTRMSDAPFPVATDLYNTTLSVPLYPALSEQQVSLIERAMSEILS